MQVYIYQGRNGENVPKTVEKLIVEEGVEELPEKLCWNYDRLQEVTLPNGLTKIGIEAFGNCRNLVETNGIPRTVQRIGREAFRRCSHLKKIEFVEDGTATSLPNELQRIDAWAFHWCQSLSRIKLPSSMNDMGNFAFSGCHALMEANLLRTGVTEISIRSFYACTSLQTVSLPNTLESIVDEAFNNYHELVTVVVPLVSQPVKIGRLSFYACKRLASLSLPKDSTVEENSFQECVLMRHCYGEDSSRIVAGLMERFETFHIHRMCYDHSAINDVQELRQNTVDQRMDRLFVDQFDMTPFHVLFSVVEPSRELLDVLWSHYQIIF